DRHPHGPGDQWCIACGFLEEGPPTEWMVAGPLSPTNLRQHLLRRPPHQYRHNGQLPSGHREDGRHRRDPHTSSDAMFHVFRKRPAEDDEALRDDSVASPSTSSL
ncbi:hypothetical protein FOZ63_018285, partial [Perkinsus olseni]